MDVVGVMAAYLWCVCALHSLMRQCLSRQCSTHTQHGQIRCHNTEYVHVNGHDRTITVILSKHCIKLPDDGSLVIETCWSILNIFKFFIIILILSTIYIFVHLLNNKVFECNRKFIRLTTPLTV